MQLLERAARSGVVWTHIPAGEARHKAVAGKLKGMGTKAGWPDLYARASGPRLRDRTEDRQGVRVSPVQIAAHAGLKAAGTTIAVAHGLDVAITILRD